VADLPLDLDPGLAERLARIVDVEGKIPRALEALGPVEDRDVLLVDSVGGIRARQLEDLGGRVHHVPAAGPAGFDAPDGSADVLVAMWSTFRGPDPTESTAAARVLRPGGRLLVVHDYGRDDVSRLRGDLPEYGTWGRRDGPYLTGGFRIRVVHCWWTFASLDDARGFLGEAFGDAGASVAAELRRPRLSYNVAIYHRTVGDGSEPG
jgi:hypothetical protein